MRCAIACFGDSLLADVLDSLLSNREDLEIFDVPSYDLKSIIQTILKTHSEVLVLCQCAQDPSPIDPLNLLKRFPSLKVITVGIEDNLVQIYDRQEIMMQKFTDLISIIQQP